LAEQQARVRALRARAERNPEAALSETPEAALQQLKQRGFTAEQVSELLSRALVRPVFTAHPSEARRRTLLEKLDHIAHELDQLEYTRLLESERADAVESIAIEVETFWLTDIVRDKRPTVADEIRHGLGLVSD